MRIAIGSDHAGFALKEAVKAFLHGNSREVLDVGTFSSEPVDYPDCAAAVGAALRDDRAERGIIVCGSGVGASISANKIPGIRAGLCHDTYSAHQGVEHDDMNVLVLGGRVVGVELAHELIDAFLGAHFSGEERHRRRLAKLVALENPLQALQVFGQSVWLDSLRRSLVTSGELRRLIDEDGVRGVTSNPAIFEKAIAGSSDYTQALQASAARSVDAQTLYEELAIRDIQDAADALRPLYLDTSTRDGYVSLEVSPLLAYDTPGTLQEARRLWRSVNRDNLMIKIPATPQGIAAIETLIGEGININATLLFTVDVYQQVADAYTAGLETLIARGGDPSRVASVASFFVSRIDSAIEGLIEERLEMASTADVQRRLRAVSGKVAIANARLAYQRYRELCGGRRWQSLADHGAQTQRLLWASTATKNPSQRDVLYLEELIGPETVTTVPESTLDAFRDHGRPRASLTEDLEGACDTMELLAETGISLATVADGLLDDGVRLFRESFEKLLRAVEKQRQPVRGARGQSLTSTLPEPLSVAVAASLAEWRNEAKVRRLWGRDASLWTGTDEGRWLGWLGITNDQLAHIQRLRRIGELARTSGFADALLLGMGGSSLAPEVLRRTFGSSAGYPALHVLDSTDPAQVRAVADRVDLRRTLVIVSSKSGSTLEPNILKEYFFERIVQLVGSREAGRRFIAITDPGSKMQEVAERDGFRHVFFGWPTIGGRYSALSDFGLVPAAIMGVDVDRLLDRAEEMVCACMPSVPTGENPGVLLGTVLGVAAGEFGRDKLTLVASPGIAAFGSWLEQLVAESTGKNGTGLIPIDGEPLAAADRYDRDRIVVYLRLLSAPDAEQDRAVDALAQAGHPVLRIALADEYDLGAEFFRWEVATAVACSILGVHPFDQPDVEESKTATRRLTAEFETRGALPADTAIFAAEGLTLFADEENAAALQPANRDATLAGYLAAHLNRLGEGDYFALLAYLEPSEAHQRTLQRIRHGIRDASRAATCLQFGPRFLHSTGQLYKGGPNSGVFLQITCDDAADLPVPGHSYTFGVVKAAQACGDLQVLSARHRRALRVHLGSDVTAGLKVLGAAISTALSTDRFEMSMR
jgi:transaldolase/glucose-6-phosphate isomerase